MPRFAARSSTSASRGSAGPAKLILMMRAPFSTDHSTALMMLKVVPSPLVLRGSNARTARTPTRGATPSMLRRAAMAPAMPVPCACGSPVLAVALPDPHC